MPLYEHDCDKCIYLGPFTTDLGERHPTGTCDLYFCGSRTGDGTVIARFSSDPPDYASGMAFGMMRRNNPDSPLGEAYRRAVGRGHYTPPTITWSSHDMGLYAIELGGRYTDPDFRAACEEVAMDNGSTTVDFSVLMEMARRERERNQWDKDREATDAAWRRETYGSIEGPLGGRN